MFYRPGQAISFTEHAPRLRLQRLALTHAARSPARSCTATASIASGGEVQAKTQKGMCGTMFIVACLFGLIAVIAAACRVFLFSEGASIKDLDTLANSFLDWMNTLSGTATLF